MSKNLIQYSHSALRALSRLEQKHPYRFSFALSFIITSFILFYSPPSLLIQDDVLQNEDLEFIDLDMVQAPKRITKKSISTDSGDIAEETTDPEKASGESEDDAVDLSFTEGIPSPQLVSRLEDRYPKIARQLNVEAVVFVNILISSSGHVKKVSFVGVRLLKELPSEMKEKVSKAFMKETFLMLKNARYSITRVNGKSIPIRTDFKVDFKLY